MHEMRWWHIKAAIDGYNSRHRTLWTAVRWHVWLVLSIFSDKLKRPTDLIKFPWEKKVAMPTMSDAEYDELQQLMREENKNIPEIV